MRKGWREWLSKAMAGRGLSIWALKTEHHFAPETLDHWEQGRPARAATVRKLARILELPYGTLLERLGVEIAKPVLPRKV